MSESLKLALTTAMTTVKSDVLEIMEVAVPAALAVVGVVMAVKIGVNFFKSLATA